MNCACHDEPCYWQKDARLKAGGRWECRVNRQRYNAARQEEATRARLTQKRRDQYDTDWRLRISTNLKRNAASRRRNLEARKARLTEEG